MNIEKIKENSNFLRGTIAEGLKNDLTGALTKDDQIILKFHGSYQQDDRDIRQRRLEKKLEPLYSFMLRLRISGGKISADQWLGIDKLSQKYASEVIKITTRQTVQLHGVFKQNLKPVIQNLYQEFGLDSISACGDVNRNVMSSIIVAKNKAYDEVYQFAQKISDELLPNSKAYHEIWLDGEKIKNDSEPLYGENYLPKKFKIAIAIPPSNDVDVFAHDIGLIAIIENEKLIGFNVSVGGGMGRTHNNSETFARLGDLAFFVKKADLIETIIAIAKIQRDFGNRVERKNARFKYVIDKYGVDWFKEKFQEYSSVKFLPTKKFEFQNRTDDFGWHQDYLNKFHYVLFVENGRVVGNKKDLLRQLAQEKLSNFRFSNNQNIIISDIEPKNKKQVESLLKKYQIDQENNSQIRLSSMACVALNTCSLALAEGQRYLPKLIDKIEEILKKYQLENEDISIRMTGCPNGCARPYVSEIALVGKSYGIYDLHLGGDNLGTRLNKIYKTDLNESEILTNLDELFLQYSQQKEKYKSFGEFSFERC